MEDVPNSEQRQGASRYLQDFGYQEIMRMAATCARWNNEKLFGVSVPPDRRSQAAACAFAITHEHHLSTITLFKTGMYSSAFALLRACFEALIRGIWLVRAATDEQATHYFEGRDTKKVEGLLRDIKKAPTGMEDAFLVNTWDASEKSLHRFTHVSYQLLIRRLNTDLVEEGMQPEEIISAVRFATGCALLASVEIAKLGGATDLEQHAQMLLGILYPDDGWDGQPVAQT
jgi:hypothetical protein